MGASKTVIIVGGGPSGLTTAYHLKRRGVPYLILERGSTPGESFARMRASMRLVSPPFFSELPGLAFPAGSRGFLPMPAFHRYLVQYAAHHGLSVRCGAEVVRATREPDTGGRARAGEASVGGGPSPASIPGSPASGEHTGPGVGPGFGLELADGTHLACRFLVCATGVFSTPHVPPDIDLSSVTVPWQHAAEYQAPGALVGREVLIVGSGLSAQEIALELCAHRPVTLSARHPIRWIPNPFLGVDLHWFAWLPEMVPVSWAPWAVPRAREPASGAPIRAALSDGRIRVRPGVTRLSGDRAHFADGSSDCFEALVLATGYRPTVQWLSGLATADQRIHDAPGGESEAHPGLFFVGFPFLRTFASRYIRGIRRDAAHAAAQIAARLRGPS